MTTHPPRTRAPKPNQHERANRQAVIDNLIGDTHDSGGFFWRLGVRSSFLEDLSW